MSDKEPFVKAGAIIPEEEKHARLKQLRERFAILQASHTHVHEQALDDDQFAAGHQWPDVTRVEREEVGRPCLTYNHLLTYVNQIVNQVRQDWPQVRVKPVESDKHQTQTIKNIQGTKDHTFADVYMGIIRNIEHQSRAEHAYDTATEHSVQHGFGYWRIMAEYANADSFDQELRIKRIRNSYSVLCGEAEEADFSDMPDSFIFTKMQKDVFEAKYPGIQYTQVDDGESVLFTDWFTDDKVTLAEYYYIDYVADELVQLSNGKIVNRSEAQEILDELEQQKGIYEVTSREVKRPVCKWLLMTGSDIIDGPLDLPFRHIPVVKVVGKEMIVDQRVEYHSAIRHAKDAQRSYNYWRTSAAEKVALETSDKIIVTPKQIKGYEADWDSAHNSNKPYLTYNPVEGVAEPHRMAAANPAAAEMANATQDRMDMQWIIGLHEASMGRDSQDRSGKANIVLQNRGDLATFIFPDNLARAIQHCARMLIDAIPRVYDNNRVMRIRMPDDTEDFVELNESIQDKETGETHYVHDLSYGKYDVVIDTGPSYQTQRQEAQDHILDVLGKLPPEKAAMVAHLLVKNMDFPGAEDVYEILRKMLPDELKSEDEKARDLPKGYLFDENGQPINEETGEPLPPPQPSPQEIAAEQAMQAESKEAEAKIAKAGADMEAAKAKQMSAQADLLEAQARIQEIQNSGGNSDEMKGVIDASLQAIQQEIISVKEKIDSLENEMDEKLIEASVDTLKRVQKANSTKEQTQQPIPQSQPSNVTLNIGGQSKEMKFIEEGGKVVGATVKPVDEEVSA